LTSLFALFVPAWLSRLASVNYANEILGPRLLLGGGLVLAANLLAVSAAAVYDRRKTS
jgi:hypothetical protein